MNWERQRQEREHFTAYAKELSEQFDRGLLKELTDYPQFIVWKQLEIEGKKKKPPFNPRTHQAASPTDPSTWSTHRQALKALSTGLYQGIGFVFTEADPFVGIDLDHCVHLNQRIDYYPDKIIRHFQSYTEYSPRDGAHILIKAKAPFTTRRIGELELFASGHTLSLTLNPVAGTPTTIEERQEELDKLLSYFDTGRAGETNTTPSVIWRRETQRITQMEERMIEHWKEESPNFARYFDGDSSLWTGDERKVNSKSEADFVLCLMLLSRTRDDVEAVKRLFRASGLFDPAKTDRPSGHDFVTKKSVTYLEMTIFNALKKRPKPGQSQNRKGGRPFSFSDNFTRGDLTNFA